MCWSLEHHIPVTRSLLIDGCVFSLSSTKMFSGVCSLAEKLFPAKVFRLLIIIFLLKEAKSWILSMNKIIDGIRFVVPLLNSFGRKLAQAIEHIQH